MTHVHLLDRLIGTELPPLRTVAELQVFEATPYDERIVPQSTYEALQLGAAHDPNAAAFQFLKKGDPEETPLTVTYAQFMARVTQSANFFNDLGVGPNDVVSLLLPLLPQAFFALFGAQAAGIANPVNPLLSPGQLTEILRAANTKVLVALGPLPGSDIWDKVQRIRANIPSLKAVVVVYGATDEASAVYSFDDLIDNYPGDCLTSGRCIAADDTAGYFHTGGTTGTPKLVRHTHRNQVYQAWAMSLMLPSGPGRTLLFGLPLFHVGGALTQALGPLSGGSTLVVVAPAGWREP
ncbi:MAG: AMP-binding protein, partial [Rhodoferax sp.]